MNIRIEIWHLGDLTAKGEFTDLKKAKAVYDRYIGNDHCAVEVYLDGERLKAPDAWKLMKGWDGYGRFRFGRSVKGEDLWREDANLPASR
ncbi:MAG: hypothetical protein IKM31_02725 [Oscillospiraceae bacterium]|nr:hypothetical protein [Oscillospiraceae bacterium]